MTRILHAKPIGAVLFLALALIGVTAWAGSLEPPGPPAPTMKTLDEIPPAWSRALPANDTGVPCNSSRFQCVLPTAADPSGEAVLDRETGLVWEKAPTVVFIYSWNDAMANCMGRSIGYRKGWRLPTAEELASLIDMTPGTQNPRHPAGHPFTSPPISAWSASSSSILADSAIAVEFVGGLLSHYPKTDAHDIWCVRGGQGHDGR